jgi:hypothetical protein
MPYNENNPPIQVLERQGQHPLVLLRSAQHLYPAL